MKLFVKILFALSIIVANISFCFAQTKSSAEPASIGKAKIVHDNDRSRAWSVFLNRDNKYIIRAFINVPTSEITKPGKIRLFIDSFSSEGLKYTSKHKIEIFYIGLKNEGKYSDPDAKVTASCNPTNANQCNEILSMILPYDFVENMLTKTESIKITLDNTVFELTKEEIDGFRDLMRIIEQQRQVEQPKQS